MTTAQLDAAAKALYKEHMVYENGFGTPPVKWKRLDPSERDLYRDVVRKMYQAAWSA